MVFFYINPGCVLWYQLGNKKLIKKDKMQTGRIQLIMKFAIIAIIAMLEGNNTGIELVPVK